MLQRWSQRGAEPSLRELMEDPITHAVMRRDGLSADEVWATVREAKRKLANEECDDVRRCALS
jgi:hypothetical protein